MYQNDSYLTDTLAVVAQNWVDDFRKTWGLDSSSPPNGMGTFLWELAKVCDQIAEQIVAATRNLERDKVDLEGFLHTLHDKIGVDPEKDTLFSQLLESHLAYDLEDELDRMRHRTLKLVKYLVGEKSGRIRAYLARVGACYLRGLETETVVMCGAVVDAALQEHLDDDEVRAAGIRCGKYVSLGNRIEFMDKNGHWDKDTVEIAFTLAEERNNAIHTNPELARDVDEVMKDLIFILSKIRP
jgi:hypothetical protein